MIYDYCVVGGGIVGLATAMKILHSDRDASLLLLEKEGDFALHQTGHNSGVIHAGVYYAPGSLKARLCREGLRQTLAFCIEHSIPFETCGKLIVATSPAEQQRIEALHERAAANGVSVRRVGGDELRELEPNITGISALLCPETSIVDYREVARAIAATVHKMGADLRTGVAVDRIIEGPNSVEIGAGDSTWVAKRLVVCAGLQSDRLAKRAGLDVDFRIIPFRGEYYQLPPRQNDIVAHLIYPAPDPNLPFLGIHLTRMIDGSVTVGPNAVLGLSREGYEPLSVDGRDLVDIASYSGFWRLISKHLGHTAHELLNSLSRKAYLADCRKYCSELTLDDLRPYRAGIRAQAVTRQGQALHDFHFIQTDRMLHVCNAPSPAATSAIPIGRLIADKVLGGALAN